MHNSNEKYVKLVEIGSANNGPQIAPISAGSSKFYPYYEQPQIISQNPAYHSAAGDKYYNARSYKEAHASYWDAIRLDPQYNVTANYGLCKIYSLVSIPIPTWHLNRALTTSHYQAISYYNHGLKSMQSGDFFKSCGATPESIKSAKEAYQAARISFQRAFNCTIDCGNIYYTFAYFYKELNSYDLAIDAFDRTMTCDPKHTKNCFNMIEKLEQEAAKKNNKKSDPISKIAESIAANTPKLDISKIVTITMLSEQNINKLEKTLDRLAKETVIAKPIPKKGHFNPAAYIVAAHSNSISSSSISSSYEDSSFAIDVECDHKSRNMMTSNRKPSPTSPPSEQQRLSR